ncbi:MAG: T9SS type A sorting domain-containing protein [Bacteroidetes bacterium]|nr:T9SS type A sorting domain-containing protein [Bacteroidota bacterium]
MKKLYTLIVFILAINVSAHAQPPRYVDLKLSLHTPVTGDTIIPAVNMLNITSDILVVGSAPFVPVDSIAYAISIDGTPLQFLVGGKLQPYRTITDTLINPGDSIAYNMTIALDTTLPLGAHNVCVQVTPYNGTIPISDSVPANNKSCATIVISQRPNTVPLVNANIASINVYPNPSTDKVNVELEVRKSNDVTIKVYDITGRFTGVEQSAKLMQGKHTMQLNTANLHTGLYLYQLSIGAETINGRFVKS